MSESTSDRDDIKQPQDHLPPADEREDGQEPQPNTFPDTGSPQDAPGVSPATAAEPEPPSPHGVDKMPPHGR